MKRIIVILLASITVMSCGNNPKSDPAPSSGSITMNLYYTGTDGNARKFVEEMESNGTADAHHTTSMMQTITALREKYDLHMSAERYHRAGEDVPTADETFIRK